MPYRNLADRTRTEYQNDPQDFIQFAEKSGVTDINHVDLPIVQRYAASLEHKGYCSLARKIKVVTIRSFLFFLYSDGYLPSNIAPRIILQFVETPTPHVLTQTECDQLRTACENSLRDRAIIDLLLQTGIKLSELTGLTLGDIDLGSSDGTWERQIGFIRVLGNRGKKERMIPLSDKLNLALKNYLRVRQNTENNILFLNRFGKPISDTGMQKMLRKYFQKTGIGRASVQTLRHTFGVNQASKGAEYENLTRC